MWKRSKKVSRTDIGGLVGGTSSLSLETDAPATTPVSDQLPRTQSDPTPYSSVSLTANASPADSDLPDPKRPSKFNKRIQSAKMALEDGHATSFAKAAYTGGIEAQSSFLKAETVTHAVKMRNTPLIAFDATRAVYKGGKQASKPWKEAEKESVARSTREGMMDENGKLIRVEQDAEDSKGCEAVAAKNDEKAQLKAKLLEEKALAKSRAKEDKEEKVVKKAKARSGK
ncbi:hypothetical protein BU23DRAFT_600706 [Bimuria novae-zelandiae CBS 107.79]|uniref:Uncharacterized protein n=1 Tax=Bimuria novae-zelandiae CBS 107.79 TaxID=1447943 RepID=A0A6A5V0K9_9PLEO|nr:hypothetical protein BU23DRAFT_600706 [Bimuria novae-zelandiae CBS 107.79]